MKVTERMRKKMPAIAAYWDKQNKAKRGAATSKKKKKHHHSEGHVAKKKKKTAKHGGKRRGGGSARRSSGRRHNHGGSSFGGGGWNTDLVLAGGGLAFGFVERKMKEDATFFLNKLPTPIAALGRTGNLTLATYLASYLLPGKWKKHARTAARVGAVITAYQLARKGEAFKEGADFFTISGPEDESYLAGDEIGDLADELEGHNVRGRFDVVVDDDDHFDGGHDEHHDEDPAGAGTPGVLAPIPAH